MECNFGFVYLKHPEFEFRKKNSYVITHILLNLLWNMNLKNIYGFS